MKVRKQRAARRFTYEQAVDDFWRQYEYDPETGCLLWLGIVDRDGYGQHGFQGKMWKAHRLVWVLLCGPIPSGLHILHSCDTPACGWHLFVGNALANMQDMWAKGRGPSGDRNGARTRPETNPWAKLNALQVRVIRRRALDGQNRTLLAKEFGVHVSTIRRIASGQSWVSVAPQGVTSMVLLIAAAFLTAGCLGNVAKIVREVAKSDRSWCVAATGYGVNLKAGGSGVGDGDMTCGDGGLSLRSQATQVGVPLTIVPQLSVGPPALIPAPAPRPPAPPRTVPQAAPEREADLLLIQHPAAAWKDTLPGHRLSATQSRPGVATAGVESGRRGFSGTLTDADLLEILRAVGAMHGVR